MSKKIRFLFAMLLICTQSAFAQVETVTGTVKDESGNPMPGVSVVIEGTTKGVATDFDGNYSIEAQKGNVLVFSYVGFTTLKKTVGEGRSLKINVVLKENAQELDDVIVIGYGTVKKADLVGSVSVMTDKSFKDQPVTKVSEALQGRMSGVTVQSNGAPGGGVQIRIRGANSINRSNDPLYVIDGIVRENGLAGINPEDVQSMQVLKDASSTAIYGSRGSNGVILITTKTGKKNESSITIESSIGIANATKLPEKLSAGEFAIAYNKYVVADTFSEDQINNFKKGIEGTDWYDEIFRTGYTQNYKVALTKGDEKTQYYISANYVSNDGIVEYTYDKRFQTRLNLTSQITPWLHLSADTNLSKIIGKGAGFGMNQSNSIHVASVYSPTQAVRGGRNGEIYLSDQYNSPTLPNPLGTLKYGGEYLSNLVNGMIDLRFDITKGLTFTTTNGIDYSDRKNYGFTSSLLEGLQSRMSNADNYRVTLQTTNNLTYANSWNKHNLVATAVYEATTSERRWMNINGNDLLLDNVGYWNIGVAKTKEPNNGYSAWSLLSYVGRLNYNYDNRYFFTTTFRADGSSKFTDNKWGYFPSIAFAWNLSNESFMQNQKVFQNVKIRTSYGSVGSQALEPYETLALLRPYRYSFGTSNNYQGYGAGNLAVPNLSWEKTVQFDVGLDFSILNNKLEVSLDFFNKKTYDGLLRKRIPAFDGGGSYWVNRGEIRNIGLDFSVTGRVYSDSDNNFSWTSTLTGTYLKNEVLSLAGDKFMYGEAVARGIAEDATIIMPGEPLGSFYGYIWEGFNDIGENKYKDITGDGSIDGADRTIIGKGTPDVTLGWNNVISYKNWDLNLFFTAALGADRLNFSRFGMSTPVGTTKFVTLKEAYFDSWDNNKTNPQYQSLANPGTVFPVSTQFLESADYLRLTNITVAYNMPKEIAKFADIRFALSCQNLFTLTGYKGYDPTSVAFSGNPDVTPGVDLGSYPTPRIWTTSIRIKF